MTDTKHTPNITVDLSTTNSHCGFGVSTEDGITIATVYADLIEFGSLPSERASQPENQESVNRAKRIVRAWNCHDELLEALEAIIRLIEHPSLDHDETLPQIIFANAAIAKARGES